MLGSCVAVLAMAVVYEGLKAARQWLKDAEIKRSRTVNYGEQHRSETPVDDVPMILPTPALLTGLVCRGLVLLRIR